jgi:4'-phosphopantetheinyl transferase EntD
MTPTLVRIESTDAQLARAEAALTPFERLKFASYTFEKRRRDWLLGRLAGKLAVAGAAGLTALKRVEIRSEENGHPVAWVDGLPVVGYDLSLTHGHGQAAALCAPGPVGLDLERLRDVPAGGWRFFLTAAEREWLAERPLGPHGEIVAWALKEAAYKALQGRTQGLHHLTLATVCDGRARLGHSGLEGDLVGRYVVQAGFCLAVATPANAALDWFDELALG